MQRKKYDVAIIGAGVVGSAILYSLSKYTNVKNIVLIEKYESPGLVNSEKNHNSQTLHFGDIETNYTLEKAASVKEGAEMVKSYVEKTLHKKPLFLKTQKMVLGVGKAEVAELEKRHKEFKTLFPNFKKVGKEELAKIEPKVVEGRDPKEPILGLLSKDGYAIDYGELACSFVNEAKKANQKIQTIFNKKVKKITKNEDSYSIQMKGETIEANVIVVASGGHSLYFAQMLGYGKKYGVLPIAGNFFRSTHKLLNGKVYTLQKKKLPFAAIHGDPHVGSAKETRFGPTAKFLPILEKGKYSSFLDFLQTSVFSFAGILSLFKILTDGVIFHYILRNFLYDMPFIGKRLFLKEIQKIIPTIKIGDMEFKKSAGGMRPQIVNTETKKMEMGEAKIIGEKAIFNITPSPGATTCLKNAKKDTAKIVEMLGKEYSFDEAKFKKDLS